MYNETVCVYKYRFIRRSVRPDNVDVVEIEEYRRKIEELEKKFHKVQTERERLLALKLRIRTVYYDDCDGRAETN